MHQKEKFPVPFSIVVSREGKWFIAYCPVLDIGTQGRSEKEVKENIKDLIEDYLTDPDTQKPSLKNLMASSVSLFSIPVKVGVSHGKIAFSRSR